MFEFAITVGVFKLPPLKAFCIVFENSSNFALIYKFVLLKRY